MNRERQQKQVELGQLDITSGSIEFLKETIAHYEELGAVEYYIGANWDRCNDYDGSYIDFYGYRDETDEEYNSRIKKEEQWEKEEIEREKKKKEEEIKRKNIQDMKDLETYLKLKEKFETK